MTAALEYDIAAFGNALEGELRKSRLSLLDVEFLAALESGRLTREQIGAWAKMFHSATRNGRVGLGNFYANSPDDSELRAEIAANLYEEETGRLSGVNRCHAHVFYDLLEACGISREEADAACSPAGPPYAPAGRRIEPENFFVELAAYGLNVESPNSEFCTRVSRALRSKYGFSERAVTWFDMHARLDAEHGEEFRKYAARAAEYPGGLERVREATLRMAPGVKHAWDGFGAWKSA